MRKDAIAKLEAYREQHRAWLDQAILALDADIAPVSALLPRIGWAIAHAFARGREQLPPPEPVDWATHRYNQYVVPHYAIMRLAGQTIPETETKPTPPTRRIVRRRS